MLAIGANRVLVLGSVWVASGCASLVSESDRPCPCVSGSTCCASVCVPVGTCPDSLDAAEPAAQLEGAAALTDAPPTIRDASSGSEGADAVAANDATAADPNTSDAAMGDVADAPAPASSADASDASRAPPPPITHNQLRIRTVVSDGASCCALVAPPADAGAGVQALESVMAGVACASTSDQLWQFSAVAGGLYDIDTPGFSAGWATWLGVTSTGPSAETATGVFDTDGGPAPGWTVEPMGAGHYALQPATQAGNCLNFASSTAIGTEPCTGAASQEVILAVDNGSFLFFPDTYRLALDVGAHTCIAAENALPTAAACADAGPWELQLVAAQAQTYYQLTPVGTDLCLDWAASASGAGTPMPLSLTPCANSMTQNWDIEADSVPAMGTYLLETWISPADGGVAPFCVSQSADAGLELGPCGAAGGTPVSVSVIAP